MSKKEKLKYEVDITLENGKTTKANIIFSFTEAGSDYVIYELEGSQEPFAAIVNDKDEIIPIIDDKELEIVEEIYNDYLDSLEEE